MHRAKPRVHTTLLQTPLGWIQPGRVWLSHRYAATQGLCCSGEHGSHLLSPYLSAIPQKEAILLHSPHFLLFQAHVISNSHGRRLVSPHQDQGGRFVTEVLRTPYSSASKQYDQAQGLAATLVTHCHCGAVARGDLSGNAPGVIWPLPGCHGCRKGFFQLHLGSSSKVHFQRRLGCR